MYEDAVAHGRKAVTHAGGSPLYLANLGYAHAMAENREEALKIARQWEKDWNQTSASPYYIAASYVGLSDPEEVFKWLEKAFSERDSFLTLVKEDPIFDSGSCLAEDREMIHKARHDNEKQVCETCKDFRRQNPRSRPLFRHRFDSAPGGSTERSEPQYREPAVPGLAGTHAAGL